MHRPLFRRPERPSWYGSSVTKLPLLLLALLVVGCKDKAPAKQAPKGIQSAESAQSASAFNVPTVDSQGPTLGVIGTANVVMLDPAGALRIGSIDSKDGKPPFIVVTRSDSAYNGSAVSTPNTSIATLAKDLGLPEIAKRRPSAFGAAGDVGSGSGAGSDSAMAANPTDVQFAQLGHPEPATSAPIQAPRLSKAFAIAHPFDVSAGIVVLADAKAPATALVDVLAITGGFIAVKRGAELGALPFAFDRQQPPLVAPNKPWLELRMGTPTLISIVPGLPMQSDMNKLPDVIKTSGMKAIDILVSADSKVSDLVAAMELARGAGIDAIGLGRIGKPNTPDTVTRDYVGPRVLAWDFFMQNMDKTDPTPFRKAFDATVEPIYACYVKAAPSAKKSEIGVGGVGRVELLVETTGKVSDLQTTGVAAPLATCTADALKAATFPPIATPVKITAQLAFVPG